LKQLPGAEISLKWLHRGSLKEGEIILTERGPAAQGEPGERLQDPRFRGNNRMVPRGLFQGAVPNAEIQRRIQEEMQRLQNRYGQGGINPNNSGSLDLRLNELFGQGQDFDQLFERMQQGLGRDLNLGLQSDVVQPNSGSVTYTDAEGNITVETVEGVRILTIEDKNGKILYEGAYSTKEEKAELPEEFRERVESLGLDKDNGRKFKLQLGQPDRLAPNSGAAPNFRSSTSSMQMMSDAEGSVEARTVNGERTLTLKNQNGDVVFEGPYTTQEEMNQLPSQFFERAAAFGFKPLR